MELGDAFRKPARASGVVGGSSAGGPDRLSSLPNCLLHTIMSSLKARQAVQTCVLSTRWRHLWRSVPCLDIDFDEFNKAPPSDDSSSSDDGTSDSDSDLWNDDPDDDDDDDDNIHNDWEHFTKYKDWEDFAVTLIRRCNIAQLDSFRLHTDGSRAPEFGNRVAGGWLRRAMKYCTPDRANQQGLSSGSWRLKRLHLCHVLLDDRFVKCVSSVCRSLEDLELDNCSCAIQSITSQSLKTLVLKRCGWHNLSEIISPTLKTLVIDGGSNIGACVLVILAPSVVYLHLAMRVDYFSGGVSLNEVPSIAKALIHLWYHKYVYARSKLASDQFKLLCSISNSTNLELSDVGTTVLGKEPKFQEFKNLRSLLLDRCDLSDDFKTLVFFLRSSPILEKLTLRCCEFPKYSNKKKGTPILNKTSSSELRGLDFLCENLKVEIIYNHGYGPHLMQLLLCISVNLSKNNVKLTKVN
ncbi:MEIOTIC F-BOX protein MOF-like [Miscanthus floridulus]|uniref:MEIOTIC F-BOX protein MOF-like n=1 Tax=Miscanthus floridulus TaxID=154761 RepID=UPI003459AE24